MRRWWVLVLTVAACGAPDRDGDGWGEDEDCDDADPDVHPGATEVCNGVDDDCDGTIDPPSSEGVQIVWPDRDGDGWGDVLGLRKACFVPQGWVTRAGDCDDCDATVNEGAGNCAGVEPVQHGPSCR